MRVEKRCGGAGGLRGPRDALFWFEIGLTTTWSSVRTSAAGWGRCAAATPAAQTALSS